MSSRGWRSAPRDLAVVEDATASRFAIHESVVSVMRKPVCVIGSFWEVPRRLRGSG